MCAWIVDIASLQVECETLIMYCVLRLPESKKLYLIKSQGQLNVHVCWKNLYIESC